MGPKRQTPGFWKPSVFFWGRRSQWAVDYVESDAVTGRHRKLRKTFLGQLISEGKQGTQAEQKEAAEAFADARLTELKKEKRETHAERRQTKLSRDQLRQAKAAFAIFDLIPFREKSLVDAVTQYRQNLRLAVDSPQLAVCVRIFLGHKEEASRNHTLSLATFKTLKQRLNNFVSYFKKQGQPAIKIGDIRAKDVIAYLDGRGGSLRTRQNYRGDLANFFNDAANPKDPNRFLNVNPMDEVSVHYGKGSNAKVLRGSGKARKTPRILQIEEVKNTLKTAIEFKESGVLGFVVAGLFLGMRPSETIELSKIPTLWDTHLKIDDEIAVVSEGVGKMGDRRSITLSENARDWLRYLHDHKLPFCYNADSKAGRKAYARFRARAYLGEIDGRRLLKLRRKPTKLRTKEEQGFVEACVPRLKEMEDVLRHCFGTNFYYQSGYSKEKTVHEMGNSVQMFITHYRGLLKPIDSFKEYWALKPSDFGLV